MTTGSSSEDMAAAATCVKCGQALTPTWVEVFGDKCGPCMDPLKPADEPRQAAARRVAHDLAYRNGVCTAQAREVFMCHGTICQEAVRALLAFPGGDAEPVAVEHAEECDARYSDPEDEMCNCGADAAATPVAWRVEWFDGMVDVTVDPDEAKRWQAKAGEDECSVEPLYTRLPAAPACATCSDLGFVTWSQPDQVGNEERHRAPCPDCQAPAPRTEER